ncbi:MAG: aminotransferase class V-fold PLP-dependent enzyme, partial [Gemmatimonadetes bacterium]|nr:aminotransferase class V-fold PLP-dependent enzyme [Gemmatimonadota bacterium]
MATQKQAEGSKKTAKKSRSFKMVDTVDEFKNILDGAGPAKADNETYWRAVRSQFPYAGPIRYTNNGTIGILPHMVLQAQIATLREAEIQDGDTGGVTYPGPNEAHEKLAALINADPSEVAVTRNSTESMNIVALGLDLKPEDEILTTTHEHYGGWSCWQNRHALFGNPIRKLDLYDPPEDEDELVRLFEEAIRPETRVLSFCHVTCTTAWRLPVRKICAMARKRGLITVIDGAQSVGMIG